VTAIAINLLVEEQLNQQAKARDPLKIAIAIGMGLLAITVSIGVILGHLVEQEKQAVGTLQAKWASMQATQSGVSGSDTKALQVVASDYLSINQARTVYGPQMALIKEVIPDSIQLTQARFAMVTEVSTARPAPEPVTGESNAKAARLAIPKSTERMDLLLDGWIVCARPEIEIDLFIKSLRTHSAFGKLLKDVRLRSISRAGTDGSTTASPSATFVIDCIYKESK